MFFLADSFFFNSIIITFKFLLHFFFYIILLFFAFIIQKAKVSDIDEMMDNRESFILSVYPTETCFSDAGPNFNTNMSIFAIDNNLYFYNIGLLVYKQTNIYKQIKYAPTVIIVYKGKVLAYLDAESDEDSKCASSQEEFNKWITKYIHAKK